MVWFLSFSIKITDTRRTTRLASPHALRLQLFHRSFMSLNQLRDVLVGVRRAHESMMRRYVQPVLAVQQPQASIHCRVPRARIPDAVDRSTHWVHPEHGAHACGYRRIVSFLGELVDLSPKAIPHGI